MDVAFFGCWKEAGHFLYGPDGSGLLSFGPFVPESLDGTLLRGGWRAPGQVDLTHFKDHTVIAFEDNTVDDRPGSNAAFVVAGRGLTREQCWAAAARAYPQIIARLQGHVRMGGR